jgi:hypothetical protein
MILKPLLKSLVSVAIALGLAMAGLGLRPSQPVQAASWVVTITDDTNDAYCDSSCSIREAIAHAGNGDTITFAAAVTGQTLHLKEPLVISKNITISGPDARITLDGNYTYSGSNTTRTRLFEIGAGSSLNINNLNLTNGYCSSTTCGSGGGTISNRGNLTLNHVTVSGGLAEYNLNGNGGAIYNDGGILTIQNAVFSNNVANGQGGGAIYNTGGTVTITASTFSANSAVFGGAIRNFLGTVIITGSTFTGNTNSALYNQQTMSVTNSTIAANPGGLYAGGIYNDGSLTVNFSTITLNTSVLNSTGAGIYQNSGTATVQNSIIAANTGSNGLSNCRGTISGANDLADDGTCGSALNSSALNLGSLGDHGGGIFTVPLLYGSTAIDATSDCSVSTDQRGVSRPQGAFCDIGAYEYENPSLSINDVTQAEGNAGTTDFTFTVTSSLIPARPVTFTVDTADGSASAAAGDYTPINAASFTLPAGAASTSVTVSVTGDTLSEADETFIVNLSNPVNGSLDDAQGLATIRNDDPAILVTPTDNLHTSEAGTTATFTVALTLQPTANVTIALSSSDLTEGMVSPSSVTFGVSDWNLPQEITVSGVDDSQDDGDQAYTIVLAAAVSDDPGYQGLVGSAVQVINIDDDEAISIYLPLLMR